MEEVIAYIVQPYDYMQLVLAVTAIVIAVVSMIYTHISFKMQKEFNIKSVKPLLNAILHIDEDCLKCHLYNDGLGPAIIQSITFSVNKTAFCSIEEILRSNDNTRTIDLSEENKVVKDTALSPEREIVLFSLDNDEGKSSNIIHDVQQVCDSLNNMYIIVKFNDLYGVNDVYSKKFEIRGCTDRDVVKKRHN
ncbi:MAG: hypothetical protein FWC41_05975 [Firmicutes bacterium]|nr:hypothetical protein [Bacillota bacterium]